MKILLAEHDRDMLMTYKKLLEAEGFEITSVVDGVQAAEALMRERYSLVITDRRLPLTDHADLQKLINDLAIPSLALIHRRVTPQILLENIGADSYISYPFFPEELIGRVRQITDRSKSNSVIAVNDITIYEYNFRCKNNTHITNEEIEIIKRVLEERTLNTHAISPYINAINNRLARLQSSSRLRFIPDKGYRLVNNNE